NRVDFRPCITTDLSEPSHPAASVENPFAGEFRHRPAGLRHEGISTSRQATRRVKLDICKTGPLVAERAGVVGSINESRHTSDDWELCTAGRAVVPSLAGTGRCRVAHNAFQRRGFENPKPAITFVRFVHQ